MRNLWPIVALWCIIAALWLAGCAPDLAALAKDSATACGTITTVYGTVKFARSNLQGGDVTCNDLQMHATPPSVPLNVQVVPVPAK